MDVHDKLDEIAALVAEARAMPMSASCIVNRGEMLALVDELRDLLPNEISAAQGLLRDREQVVEEGRQEADRIIAEAERERARLVSRSEVAQEAGREAERMLGEAREQVEQMRLEVDEYVDAKLANFEVVLHKTLTAVERGREKLRGRHPLDDLTGFNGDHPHDDTPLPGIAR